MIIFITWIVQHQIPTVKNFVVRDVDTTCAYLCSIFLCTSYFPYVVLVYFQYIHWVVAFLVVLIQFAIVIVLLFSLFVVFEF